MGCIDVVAAACPEADVVQAGSGLVEALGGMGRLSRPDSEGRPISDAVVATFAIEDRLHPEEGQQLGLEAARAGKMARGQENMGNPIDLQRSP